MTHGICMMSEHH